MDEKHSADQYIFETKHKEITEKDHQWKDEELYPEADQQLSCCQRFKIGFDNFKNRTIDYFEFDRIFFLEGETKIDLKKCHKKFLEEYLQTYSQRQLRFGYSFDYVLEQKIKQQKRKEKSFCRELYRFICCEGGNQMNQIDQYYKSEREFEQLLKKKIMERKDEFKEEKRKEQEKQIQLEKENNRITTQNQILDKHQEEQPYGDIPVQNLEYYEEPVGTKKQKKKKQGEKKTVSTEILQVKRNQKQEENNIFDYQNDYVQQKISGRKEKQGKQPSKPTTHQNSQFFDFQNQENIGKNQIAKSKGTSSHTILTSNKNEVINPSSQNNSTIITKNIYRENVITTNTYHQNIIKRNRELHQDVDNYNEQNQYNQKKTRKNGRRKEETDPEEQPEHDQVRVNHKKTQNKFRQPTVAQSSPKKLNNNNYQNDEQNVYFQTSPKLRNQQLLFTSPRNQQNIINKTENNSSKKNHLPEDYPQSQQVENTSPKKTSNKTHEVEDQINQNQNVSAKKKSKKNRNNHIQPQQEQPENTRSTDNNYQTIDEPRAAKSKKIKKNRNTSNNSLQITQTTHEFESHENIEKTNPNQNVEPDDEEYNAAKKRRKQKKQVKNQDQEQSNEINLNIMGNSSSPQTSFKKNKSPRNRDVDQNEEEQFKQAAKKRKVKKQLKEKPSEQTFDMIFLDDLEDNQKGNSRNIEKAYNQIVYNDMEDQAQTGVKAQKKRKKAKTKKQVVQQDFDEVVNIEF